jgi:GTP-binding protein
VETAPKVAEDGNPLARGLRNIAIIAHVDHGKTTLVDAMLAQSNIFRANQAVQERIMDSNDLERERGITILSKNTAVTYKGLKINIIDTPGHADFGGEVERVLNMCDGVLLLVDSVEGPMPQTRFVLKKALALDKKVIVVVNKIDRPAARPDWVIDQTFDLFVELGANDDQCDFPVVYASGANGVAGDSVEEMSETLEPLFEAVVREVSPPKIGDTDSLQMMVTNLDFDQHKGRLAIGRVNSGKLIKGQTVAVCKPGDEKVKTGKMSEVFVFSNFTRVPVDEVVAGDICAVTGLGDVSIGETLCNTDNLIPLPAISIEEPTVRMTFMVNTSPFAGREGKFVTTRNIKDRLDRELERNLALRVEPGDTADSFTVSGRGTLHIAILIENMRREGYEFAVGPPKVITKTDEEGHKLEPFEEALVEVPEEYVGPVVDLLGSRKGQMSDLHTADSGLTRITYVIPTRGLLGIRSVMLTATKGLAVLNTNFKEYGRWTGDIVMRDNGSLVSYDTGPSSSYALESIQARGKLFIPPGRDIYKGQVIGIHQRQGDLEVNACKRKAATNIRSAGKDHSSGQAEPIEMDLDACLEYIADDELVEVTPVAVRMRKSPKGSR